MKKFTTFIVFLIFTSILYSQSYIQIISESGISVFLEAIGNSSLQRIIWTSPFEPSEEILSTESLVYIICKDKQLAHDVILDFEGRAEVETEVINLIN